MKKPIKPTAKEKQLATQMQNPTSAGSDKPVALTKATGIFGALLKTPTASAETMLGGERTEWINAMNEINPLFPNAGSNFSRPFFALRAWYFESKNATQKSRMGLKLALPDDKVYHISLSYPANEETQEAIYPDRAAVLEHFENSTQAVGLMQFEKVDRGQANPYWRLIYADEHSLELAGETMPQAQQDEEIPF